MVGYEQDDTLTPNQKIIAGCISGGMTRFITQPLDIIKLRTQLQKKGALGQRRFFRTTRAIFKEEGVTAFWAGHNLGQFYVFLCGIFAGCCSATLVLPIEVIRVRQMLVKAQYGGLLQGARQVYSTGGFLAFYEGLGAALLQMGPSSGISFAVFRFTQPLVLNLISSSTPAEQKERHSANLHKPHVMLIASALAGSLAGFVAKTCTYPFDLAKRRLQISSHQEDPTVKTPKTAQNLVKCHNLSDCIRITLRKEGVRGLYRGWKVTVYKAQVSAVVSFSTYEMICMALREQLMEDDDDMPKKKNGDEVKKDKKNGDVIKKDKKNEDEMKKDKKNGDEMKKEKKNGDEMRKEKNGDGKNKNLDHESKKKKKKGDDER